MYDIVASDQLHHKNSGSLGPDKVNNEDIADLDAILADSRAPRQARRWMKALYTASPGWDIHRRFWAPSNHGTRARSESTNRGGSTPTLNPSRERLRTPTAEHLKKRPKQRKERGDSDEEGLSGLHVVSSNREDHEQTRMESQIHIRYPRSGRIYQVIRNPYIAKHLKTSSSFSHELVQANIKSDSDSRFWLVVTAEQPYTRCHREGSSQQTQINTDLLPGSVTTIISGIEPSRTGT